MSNRQFVHVNLFFFNDTATTEIYTLSLHDALPILIEIAEFCRHSCGAVRRRGFHVLQQDRKSTRLNSSHSQISYAVFCLKKKTPTYCLYSPYRSSIRSRSTLYSFAFTHTA